MTGAEMMMQAFAKLIPRDIWEATGAAVETLKQKVIALDARLTAIETMQVEILHQLYHLRSGTSCPRDHHGEATASSNGHLSIGCDAHTIIVRRREDGASPAVND